MDFPKVLWYIDTIKGMGGGGMTVGQRIAQKRKEQNMSQEALGEKLGVSRQSIYKWESDGTLPEIDKLVTMSRLFGVSVGWLLGVEEMPLPAGDWVGSDWIASDAAVSRLFRV